MPALSCKKGICWRVGANQLRIDAKQQNVYITKIVIKYKKYRICGSNQLRLDAKLQNVYITKILIDAKGSRMCTLLKTQ